jgi:hypothetical protein
MHVAISRLQFWKMVIVIHYFLVLRAHDLIEFSKHLSSHGFEVHTQLEEPSHFTQTPLEDLEGTLEDRSSEITRRLKMAYEGELDSQGHKRVLIIKNSHIGGHRYAGNAIVSSHQGPDFGSFC